VPGISTGMRFFVASPARPVLSETLAGLAVHGQEAIPDG
jgi:hypothetical protein